MAKERTGTIRLACCPYATGVFAIQVAEAMEAALPGTHVELTSVRTPRLTLEMLETGRADAAFMWLPAGDVGLNDAVIRTDAREVVVPAGHPPAGRDAVTLADLAAEAVVRPAVLTSAEAERHWLADPRPDGSRAPRGPVVDSVEDCMLAVARGHGVWMAPEPLRRSIPVPGNLRWIPVSDGDPFDLAVVWTGRAPAPLIARLVAEAREITGRRDP